MEKESTYPAPKVSVLIPAYNAQRYLEQAVHSVLAQTVTDLEILILDDGSQDETARIAQRLAAEDVRIRFYRNGENIGAAGTRNRGITLCRGTYIAFLDSDDFWYPDKLETQLELAEQKDADIVYCSYALVDAEGKQLCQDFLVPETTDFDAMLRKNVLSCSTVLLYRQKLADHHFAPEYEHEDLAMWLELLADGWRAVGSPLVLAAYRIHAGSRTANKLVAAVHRWKIYRAYLKMPLGKSIACFTQYAVNGLHKYQKTEKGSTSAYAGFGGQPYGVQQHQ